MRQAIGKSETVVDVMDVAVADAEVLLDLLRMQDLPIADQRARAGGKLVRDLEQVPCIALGLHVPRALRKLVRYPLHEEGRADATPSIRQRSIDGGVHVPFDARKVG